LEVGEEEGPRPRLVPQEVGDGLHAERERGAAAGAFLCTDHAKAPLHTTSTRQSETAVAEVPVRTSGRAPSLSARSLGHTSALLGLPCADWLSYRPVRSGGLGFSAKFWTWNRRKDA